MPVRAGCGTMTIIRRPPADDAHITGTLYFSPLSTRRGPEWNTMIITLTPAHFVELNGQKIATTKGWRSEPNLMSNLSAAAAPTKVGSAFRITATMTSSFSKKSASSP